MEIRSYFKGLANYSVKTKIQEICTERSFLFHCILELYKIKHKHYCLNWIFVDVLTHVLHIDADINMCICVCAQLSVSNARLSL